MLNKYTLNFLYKDQSDKYLQQNSPKIIKEHLNFTVYALTFAILNMVQFILAQSVYYSILAGFSCFLIVGLQKLITHKPYLINYVISFYQFYVLFIVEVNKIMDSSNKTNDLFNWSYGYQTCFMHFCLYLQGTDMMVSTSVLLITTTIHVLLLPFDEIYSIAHILSFFFMMICMVAVKYNYERKKKEEFFYSFQQEQWEWIIRKAISNTIILIRYDQKQDQIRLVKQSIRSQQTHGINGCYDLRQFLRNLIFANSTYQHQSCDQANNLEQYVRNMLMEKKTNFLEKQDKQKYFIDQINKIFYKVKLTKCILNNEVQCLLILDKIQIPDQKSQDMLIIFLQELSKNVSQLIKDQFYCSAFQPNINKSQSTKKQIDNLDKRLLTYAYLQMTLFNLSFLTQEYKYDVKSRINNQDLIAQLQSIFKNKIKISCEIAFKCNPQIFISIILCCCKFTHFTENYLPNLQIDFLSPNNEMIEMNLIFCLKQPSKVASSYSILAANWASSNKRQFNQKCLFEACINRLCFLQSFYELPKLLLFDVSTIQILMSQFCTLNHFIIQQNEHTLKFVCTFQKLY
ncbi:unnamed protein product [Paramecium octaurelia]|uniref:Transmembrane protein n=1 Tax=Paramecium octaurelia TaxID=43137 RepID=A0A8S1WW13_PAROT|nr:unnamed protein product [Paramecium octaurelia]